MYMTDVAIETGSDSAKPIFTRQRMRDAPRASCMAWFATLLCRAERQGELQSRCLYIDIATIWI